MIVGGQPGAAHWPPAALPLHACAWAAPSDPLYARKHVPFPCWQSGGVWGPAHKQGHQVAEEESGRRQREGRPAALHGSVTGSRRAQRSGSQGSRTHRSMQGNNGAEQHGSSTADLQGQGRDGGGQEEQLIADLNEDDGTAPGGGRGRECRLHGRRAQQAAAAARDAQPESGGQPWLVMQLHVGCCLQQESFRLCSPVLQRVAQAQQGHQGDGAPPGPCRAGHGARSATACSRALCHSQQS